MSTDVIREGRRLRAVPLPVDLLIRKHIRQNIIVQNYQPEWVLIPGTKITLAPFGVPLSMSVLRAAEVASQISVRVLAGKSRVREVVLWRHAAYIVMMEMIPGISGVQASRRLNRDHSSMLHARDRHKADPSRLASKIAAIKAVLQ